LIPDGQCDRIPAIVKRVCGCHPPCSVCGEGKEIDFPDAVVEFPGQPSIRCDTLQSNGLVGGIPAGQCERIPNLINRVCGCDPRTPDPTPNPTRPPTQLPTSLPTPNPTRPPVPSPTNLSCNICGDDMSISIPDGIVEFPGQSAITCEDLQTRGSTGLIPNGECDRLSGFVDSICGCNDPCSVCGNGKEVDFPDAIVEFPGQSPISCAELQTNGLLGRIPSGQCARLSVLIDSVCGCDPRTPDPSPNPTPKPNPNPTPNQTSSPIQSPAPTTTATPICIPYGKKGGKKTGNSCVPTKAPVSIPCYRGKKGGKKGGYGCSTLYEVKEGGYGGKKGGYGDKKEVNEGKKGGYKGYGGDNNINVGNGDDYNNYIGYGGYGGKKDGVGGYRMHGEGKKGGYKGKKGGNISNTIGYNSNGGYIESDNNIIGDDDDDNNNDGSDDDYVNYMSYAAYGGKKSGFGGYGIHGGKKGGYGGKKEGYGVYWDKRGYEESGNNYNNNVGDDDDDDDINSDNNNDVGDENDGSDDDDDDDDDDSDDSDDDDDDDDDNNKDNSKDNLIDISSTLNTNGHFTTLVSALYAVDLMDSMSGSWGPFTVFAPTNDAFDDLPGSLTECLANPKNKAELSYVLSYHITAGRITSSDFYNTMTLQTYNGDNLIVDTNRGIKVNDAMITSGDILASNGVIYAINSVLIPPGFNVAKFIDTCAGGDDDDDDDDDDDNDNDDDDDNDNSVSTVLAPLALPTLSSTPPSDDDDNDDDDNDDDDDDDVAKGYVSGKKGGNVGKKGGIVIIDDYNDDDGGDGGDSGTVYAGKKGSVVIIDDDDDDDYDGDSDDGKGITTGKKSSIQLGN